MAGWQDAPVVSGGGWKDAPVVNEGPSGEVVATTKDGGRVLRMKDGSLSFTSPSYSTNDQARIQEIMQGAQSPSELVTSDFDKQTIAQAPITARAVKAVEGTQFIGSYLDEAAGAMFGEKAQQGVQALSGAMARENPGESTALGLVGSVASAIPMALAAGPAIAERAAGTLGAKAIQGGLAGAVAGGIEGLIYGAGQGEGNERVANARSGGTFGLLAGGAFGAIAPYLGEAAKQLVSWSKGSDVKAVQGAFGVSPEAARVIKDALDAGDVQEARKALIRAGKDSMLADAGLPARQLLDAAANTGGSAGRIVANAVDDRATKAASDFGSILDNTLGKPAAGLKSMAEDVRVGTSANRQKVYNEAYDKAIDYSRVRGRAILNFLKRVPGSAINDANELMKLEGVQSKQIMATIADDGSVTYQRLPDVRQIDYIARALGGVADKADGQGKLGGTTPLGRGYQTLQKNLRRLLRAEVPEYGVALDTASDAISRVKSGETGYALLRDATKREDVIFALRGASKADKDAMKQGVRTYLDDTLATVKAALTDPNTDAREAVKGLATLSSRANETKLRYLLGSKETAALMKEVDRVRVAYELKAAVAQNSKTAIRQSIQGRVDQLTTPGTLEYLASGKPQDAAKRFVQIFTGSSDEAKALRQAGIYEEIATVLTQTRGGQARNALRIVNKAMAGSKISAAEAQIIGNAVATSSVLVGSRQGNSYLSTP